ncbi:MAG TPA: hypothetical protein VFR81_02360 [Longimicrobium sp.]|nr:hypothetical protein [Longimicrobium sp.]
MASRTYVDGAGVEWTVWDVVPGDHAATPRQHSSLPEEMSGGWLCFENSTAGRLRMYPVPADWAELPDDKLALLHRAAVPVRLRLPDAAPGPEPEATASAD